VEGTHAAAREYVLGALGQRTVSEPVFFSISLFPFYFFFGYVRSFPSVRRKSVLS